MSRIFEKVFGTAIFTIRIPAKDESFLWWVDDGEFVYTHFLQIGSVKKKKWGAEGVQLIIGPVNFTLAWLPRKIGPNPQLVVKSK
jgi:hypothetical protein